MKKLLFTLFSVIFLFSCSESAKDIDATKIDNVCDLLDACEIVADEAIELQEKYKDKDESDVPDSAKKEMKNLYKKIEELMERADEKGWEEDELEKCKKIQKKPKMSEK